MNTDTIETVSISKKGNKAEIIMLSIFGNSIISTTYHLIKKYGNIYTNKFGICFTRNSVNKFIITPK